MAFLFLNIKPHLDELKGQSKCNWFPQPRGPLHSDNNTVVKNAGFLIRFNETTALAQQGFVLKTPRAKSAGWHSEEVSSGASFFVEQCSVSVQHAALTSEPKQQVIPHGVLHLDCGGK